MRAGHVVAAGLLTFMGSPSAAAPFLYRVERPAIDALLSAEFESDESRSEAAISQTDTRTTTEKLDIRTDGWVYHPALLAFSAGFRPEFQQERVEQDNGVVNKAIGSFLGYGIDANVLPYKPYTLDLHASQDRNKYKSNLARDQVSESTIYRARLRLKEYLMPTAFTVESRDLITETFNTMRDRTELARLESKHRSENSDTQLEAEYQDRSRGRIGEETASQQLVVQAQNRYRPSAAINTSSNLRHTWDRWLGTDSTQTSLNTGMWVQHREKLRSDYHLYVDERREQGYDSRSGGASASLQHQLYENLTTTLSGDANKSRSSSGDIDAYGGAIDLYYTRPIPWGRVNANVGHTERIEDWRQLLTERRVSGEVHTITFDQPWVELAHPDIDPMSIAVWSQDRSVRYVEGIEYQVDLIGRNVRISWIPVLTPGEAAAIVVDYRYATDPSAKTRLIGDSFGAGLNLWSMLGLRYDRHETRMDLLSGAHGTRDTQDRTSNLLSASVSLGRNSVKSITRASKGRVEFAAEEWAGGRGAATQDSWGFNQLFRVGNWSATSLEVEDMEMSGDRAASSRQPTRTKRARQTFTFRPTPQLSLSAGGNYSEIQYKDTRDYAQSRGYDAWLRWLVGPGSLFARAYTRDTHTSIFGTESTGAEAEYQWKWGPWHPAMRGSLAKERQLPSAAAVESERIRAVLYLELKREFR